MTKTCNHDGVNTESLPDYEPRASAPRSLEVADLVASIRHAESALSSHIEEFHDFDYQPHEVPPELQQLRDLQHHLLGSLINNDGELYEDASVPSVSTIDRCIQTVIDVGNFRDYKRDELTADFGQPKFDMMHAIIDALQALKGQRSAATTIEAAEREPTGHVFECPDCGKDCADDTEPHAADCERRSTASTARPQAFLARAIEVYGDVATDPKERALRFVEEAIELAQAANIPPYMITALMERVYSRPAGAIATEIGQSQVTLELLAENLGLSAEQEAQRDWENYQARPVEDLRARYAAKQAAGITVARKERGTHG